MSQSSVVERRGICDGVVGCVRTGVMDLRDLEKRQFFRYVIHGALCWYYQRGRRCMIRGFIGVLL